MNTVIRHLTNATMIAATVAAAFLAQAAHAAAPKVIQLDTVYVTGKRIVAEPVRVVQLPTVTIVAKRHAAESAQIVQLPTVYITGKRSAQATLLAKGERAVSL